MIPCTLRQLEIFLAAAEDCHFARTANRLRISQPAITSHIKTLEEQLGHKLFIRRKGSRPLLSQEGATLLRQAKAFMAEGNKINALRARSETARKTMVRISSGDHLLDCIRPHLPDFYDRYPDISVEFHMTLAAEKAMQLVQRGQVDLFLFTIRNPSAFALNSEVLRTVRFRLYANPSFLEHKAADAEAISALPFILPLEGSPPDGSVTTALTSAGIVCSNIVARTQYPDVMIDMAKAGRGIIALYETMVTQAVEKGDLISFDLELPLMHRCIFRLDDVASPPIEIVQAFLREILSR